MIRPVFGSLFVTVLVGLVVFGIGWATLAYLTADTRFMNMPPPPAASVTTVVSEILSGGDTTTQIDESGWRETIRKRASEGLIKSFAVLALIATVLAAAWQLYAWRLIGRVGTTSGSNAAAPLWIVGLLATIGGSAWTLWTTFNHQGPAALMIGKVAGGMIVLSLLLAWLIYHLATALGAPLQLRGSVPLAKALPIGRAQA
jgi:hypothetical protein